MGNLEIAALPILGGVAAVATLLAYVLDRLLAKRIALVLFGVGLALTLALYESFRWVSDVDLARLESHEAFAGNAELALQRAARLLNLTYYVSLATIVFVYACFPRRLIWLTALAAPALYFLSSWILVFGGGIALSCGFRHICL